MLLAQDTFHTNNFESFASSRKFLTEETLSTPMALSPLPYLPSDGGDVRAGSSGSFDSLAAQPR
jgi:hypothetical protein